MAIQARLHRYVAWQRLMLATFAGVCVVLPLRSPAEEIRSWTDATGQFKRNAVFQRVDGDIVVLKSDQGKELRIPLERLSTADQAYAKAAAVKGSVADPFEGVEDTHRSADPAVANATDMSRSNIRVVVAQGVGITTEDAKKDAYREAVRQVVGTLVAAATIVDNDAVIEDKVLSLSGGFLDRVDMLAGFPKQEGSLWKVKIKAEVQVTEVLATLGKANVTTLAIRSDDLEAQRITISDQQSAKLDALNDPRMWENFPGQFFTLTVTQQPKVTKAGPDRSQLSYSVELAPNLGEYKVFANKLGGILGKTGGRSGEFSNDGLKPNCDRNQVQQAAAQLWRNFFCTSYGIAGSLLSQRDQSDFLKRFEDTEPSSPEAKGHQYFCFDQGGYTFPKACGLDKIGEQMWQKAYDRQDSEFVLCMLAESNKSYSKTRWKWFVCNREDFPAGQECPWLRGIECEITFQDSGGGFIATDSFAIGNGIGVSRYGEVDNAKDGGMIFMSPFWIPPATTGSVWDRKGYVAVATFNRTSEVDNEEVKNLTSVVCRVKTLPIKPAR